nr:tail terminator [Klebsiella phage vB_Kpn_K21lambda1]
MRQHDLTESTLRAHWVAGAFGLPTAYENQAFSKPDDAPWAALWYVPADTQPVTAGSRGQDEVVGFLQIDLNYPLNKGTGDTRTMADKIADHFPVGHPLVYNGFVVKPTYVHRGQGREVDGWWRTPITIGWYSRLNRLGA